jgi:hypothetical protein
MLGAWRETTSLERSRTNAPEGPPPVIAQQPVRRDELDAAMIPQGANIGKQVPRTSRASSMI